MITQEVWPEGWRLVPLKAGTKTPLVAWRKFVETEPTDTEREHMAQCWAEGADYALLAGEPSGVVILDFDSMDAYHAWAEDLPKKLVNTLTAQTKRGAHVYFKVDEYPPNSKFALVEGGVPVGDILSTGKIAVLPNPHHARAEGESLDRNGRGWLRPQDQIEGIAKLKSIEQAGIVPLSLPPRRFIPEAGKLQDVSEGNRHHYLIRMGARLRAITPNMAAIESALYELNAQNCRPPLPREAIDKMMPWLSKLGGQSEEELIRNYMANESPYRHLEKPTGEFLGRDRVIGIFKDPPEVVAPEDVAFIPIDEYMKQKIEDVPWIIDGLLPQGYLVVLGGTSKCGKSVFLTKLAVEVARGGEFLGGKSASVPVLWLCYEESPQERIYAFQQHDVEGLPIHVCHDMPLIDTEEGIAAIRKAVKDTGAKLIVIDPLYGAIARESLTGGAEARGALAPMKKLTAETGATCLIVHHLNKNIGQGLRRERMADSAQLLAAASMDIVMDASIERGHRLIRLLCRGRGLFANQNWIVKSRGMSDFALAERGEGVSLDMIQREERIAEWLREAARENPEGGGFPVEAIAEAMGLNLKTAQNLLTSMARSGMVSVAGRDGRRKLYLSS